MIIGTYSGPPAPTGGSSSANSYSTIQELLIKLPDNTANQIQAKDVRDSVFTLWERISGLSASIGSNDVTYNRTLPSTAAAVGGVSTGSTFSGTIQDVLDRVFYPYAAPSVSLSVASTNPREYGFTTIFNLSWSVTRNGNSPITTITVDGTGIVPTGNSQAGTKTNVVGTYSVATINSSVQQFNLFNMSASDGITSPSTSTTLYWQSRRYWGRVNLSSIGNPNLTANPSLAPLVSTITTDTIIKALTGAGANGSGLGSELSTTKTKTYNGIDGNGWYLIFAWPSSFAGSYIPSFSVNGLPNTAFTRVRTNSPFVNQYGITSNYEVWVSNTTYGMSSLFTIS
jgi:hypothetical protein